MISVNWSCVRLKELFKYVLKIYEGFLWEIYLILEGFFLLIMLEIKDVYFNEKNIRF